MRRPKRPGKAEKVTEEESAPGGRARRRLEQFNLQRGLPTTLRSGGERGGDQQKASLKRKSPTKK